MRQNNSLGRKYCQMTESSSEFDHKAWLKDFSIALQNREGFRDLRAVIFHDTVSFVQNSSYSIGGQSIRIDSRGIIERTELYDKPIKLAPPSNEYKTRFSVIGADCLETARVLLNAELNPCVLNMANRQNPGGGVYVGAGAQEENIFRRTNMFRSLFQFADFAEKYDLLRNSKSYPMDRNYGGAYSPDITVFRGSEANGYCLLSDPYKIAVVTVAALNRPELIKREGAYYLANNMVTPTKEKMRTILRIAGKHKHDSLVLSAFGCGAFANPPNHIAELFKEVFAEKEFNNRFKVVVFSIIDDHNSKKSHNPDGNIIPFTEIFG